MKRGPKPKPTALKLLSGSWRAKENPHEPVAPKALPAKPAELSEDESVLWDILAHQLYDQGTLGNIDHIALHSLVSARCEEMRAENQIRKSGLLIRNGRPDNPNAQLIPNPLLGIRDRAAKRVKEYLAVFGMTPADRTRIIANPGAPLARADPVTELIDGL